MSEHSVFNCQLCGTSKCQQELTSGYISWEEHRKALAQICPAGIRFDRVWEMPNKFTFAMKSAAKLLSEEIHHGVWIDPFAGWNSPGTVTNDADLETPAKFHMDGLEFLRSLDAGVADGFIFDPPYSCEQVLRSYKGIHKGTAGREEYHARCLDEASRLVKPEGKLIRFAWNSAGGGKDRGFVLRRILLICHGAAHNDTICTVETKEGLF